MAMLSEGSDMCIIRYLKRLEYISHVCDKKRSTFSSNGYQSAINTTLSTKLNM